jgi:serine/threonine-protein phosphatase 2A regulatory subunit B'
VNADSATSAFLSLPTFKDVPNIEKQNLFIKMLNLCCAQFDFTDPTKNIKEKEIKRQTLVELVDYIASATGKFSEASMQEITQMLSANLFRTLSTPPRENKVDGFDVDEEEPSWTLHGHICRLFMSCS